MTKWNRADERNHFKMKTRAQRVTFRAILVAFTLASLFFACFWGFHAEDPIAMFLVIFVPGLVAGLIAAGLVVWVMKAFSEEPPQDNDDSDKDQ
jgi:peptidoglycan/LPS O-acetylase OafA/YrhL